MPHQIRPLIRSAYDLFLNFYIDWLWPEKIGPLLQAVAILKRGPSSDRNLQELRSILEKTYGGLVNLCTNAAEKGRLSPLGSSLHQKIYSSLSPIVHQDFSATLEYSSTLDSGIPNKMELGEIMENIRWLDVIIAATLSRVNDDVGAYGPHAEKFGSAEDFPLEESKLRHVFVRFDNQRE